MKQKKEKPRYNVWQNTVYVITGAWKRDKTVLWVILAQVVLAVAVSTVALFLPKTVVAHITGGATVGTLVRTVLTFTTATVLLQAVKNYLDTGTQLRRTYLRVKICGDILDKVMTTDYSNLEKQTFNDAKQKTNDMTNNNSAATEQIYHALSNFGINVLGFVVYVTLLVSVNPLVLVLTAVAAITGTLVRRWAERWRFRHNAEEAVFNKRMWHMNFNMVNNEYAKDIRLFAMTDWLKDIHNATVRMALDFNRKVALRQFLADAADCLAAFLREGAAYAYLLWRVLYHGMPVDQFVLLFAAIAGFSGWIVGIMNEYSTLLRYSLDYCRLREFLEFPDHFNRENGEPIAPERDKTYALELRGVSFRYPGAAENTLENINLTIKAGEKLAVVGLNGAGKTTLVKLLCGFYDPTEGAVLLNGKDIRGYNREQYYSLFTAVFQEFNILPLSVAENIAQCPEAEADSEKMRHCLSLADLDKKITALPNGTSSLLLKNVNEEAVAFSGGETQRLMLARALYKDSPILILDEPTAALDPIAESNLYQRYGTLSSQKTSIYISHRLASTRFCDRIILINERRIAENGTHDELMRQGGKYAELFEIQSKYYKEQVEGEAV